MRCENDRKTNNYLEMYYNIQVGKCYKFTLGTNKYINYDNFNQLIKYE